METLSLEFANLLLQAGKPSSGSSVFSDVMLYWTVLLPYPDIAAYLEVTLTEAQTLKDERDFRVPKVEEIPTWSDGTARQRFLSWITRPVLINAQEVSDKLIQSGEAFFEKTALPPTEIIDEREIAKRLTKLTPPEVIDIVVEAIVHWGRNLEPEVIRADARELHYNYETGVLDKNPFAHVLYLLHYEIYVLLMQGGEFTEEFVTRWRAIALDELPRDWWLPPNLRNKSTEQNED